MWSTLQNLNIDTPAKAEALQADRDYHEAIHLRLCLKGYNRQLREGRHAALEQPWYATSWKTKTLATMPGHDASFHQCAFGCKLPDEHGNPQYIKKPTTVRCTDDWMAFELTRRCDVDHFHLPIEGSSPGIGSRAEAAGVYQMPLCKAFFKAIAGILERETELIYVGEDAEPDVLAEAEREPVMESSGSVATASADRGVLQRLHQGDRRQAERTVSRLHRNLGHPTSSELVRLLQQKCASDSLVQAARDHQCGFCDVHKRPTGVPVSTMPRDVSFNQRVQADTLWVQVPGQRRQQPVLMISDSATRLLAARHLRGGEKAEEFIKQLERAWLRSFGPMRILAVDEHRAWSSEVVREWCTENGIELQVSPGQSHTRLAILERRHQVTRRAISLFLHANPSIAAEPDGLVTALNYVVPQINRTPNVSGYSPIQWTLGYTPHVPGLLMEEPTGDNPAQLSPSEQFMEKLRLQQEATKAMMAADTDRKLRRALLRKFMGRQTILSAGDQCFYWRDAPAGSPAKVRWRGPATVVMREEGRSGPTSDIYWLAHGTSLLRAAPEHVRAISPTAAAGEPSRDPLDVAKQALDNVRGRGVTNYTDLSRTNKRQRDQVDSEDEEVLDDRLPAPDGPPAGDYPDDEWQSSDDGKTWTRLHHRPRQALYVPTMADNVPVHLFTPDRVTIVRRGAPSPDRVRFQDQWIHPQSGRELHYWWTGSTTFVLRSSLDDELEYYPSSGDEGPSGPPDAPDADAEPTTGLDPPFSSSPTPTPGPGTGHSSSLSPGDPSAAVPRPPDLTTQIPVPATSLSQPTSTRSRPEPLAEPETPMEAAYHPPGPETFQEMRTRLDRQETLLFKRPEGNESSEVTYGPQRAQPQRETPYSTHNLGEEEAMTTADIEVDLLDPSTLPPGWTLEHGFVQLGDTQEGNYLVRRHFLGRKTEFTPTPNTCPLPLKFLDKHRVTRYGRGLVSRDKWRRSSPNRNLRQFWWTGQTKFKLHSAWKKQAGEEFLRLSNGHEAVFL